METFHEDVRLETANLSAKFATRKLKELPTVGGNMTGMRNHMRTVGVLAYAVTAAGGPPLPQRAVLLTPHPALTERMRRMECAATHASCYQSSCSFDEIWYPDFDWIITFDIWIWKNSILTSLVATGPWKSLKKIVYFPRTWKVLENSVES